MDNGIASAIYARVYRDIGVKQAVISNTASGPNYGIRAYRAVCSHDSISIDDDVGTDTSPLANTYSWINRGRLVDTVGSG